MASARAGVAALLPTYAAADGFDSLLDTAVAAVRGAALAAWLPGSAPEWSDWSAMREHLLHCFDALIDGRSA